MMVLIVLDHKLTLRFLLRIECIKHWRWRRRSLAECLPDVGARPPELLGSKMHASLQGPSVCDVRCMMVVICRSPGFLPHALGCGLTRDAGENGEISWRSARRCSENRDRRRVLFFREESACLIRLPSRSIGFKQKVGKDATNDPALCQWKYIDGGGTW